MGPTACVLLPTPLTDAGRDKLEEMLAAISEPIPELPHCFWVHTTRPVGGTHLATRNEERRPFSLEEYKVAVEPPEEPEEDDANPTDLAAEPAEEAGGAGSYTEYYSEGQLAEIERVFGFRPTACLGVGANCNGDEDHRILAELLTHLSETFGGVIGLGGRLYGRVPADVAAGFIGDSDARWRQQEQYVAAVIASLPGVCVDIGGEYCCDATFLRAWVDHPFFRMVK